MRERVCFFFFIFLLFPLFSWSQARLKEDSLNVQNQGDWKNGEVEDYRIRADFEKVLGHVSRERYYLYKWEGAGGRSLGYYKELGEWCVQRRWLHRAERLFDSAWRKFACNECRDRRDHIRAFRKQWEAQKEESY